MICAALAVLPSCRRTPATPYQTFASPEEAVKHDVLLAAQPTKKFVTVEEVAALAAFLCSDQAGSITGALLPMDGGWTAQ